MMGGGGENHCYAKTPNPFQQIFYWNWLLFKKNFKKLIDIPFYRTEWTPSKKKAIVSIYPSPSLIGSSNHPKINLLFRLFLKDNISLPLFKVSRKRIQGSVFAGWRSVLRRMVFLKGMSLSFARPRDSPHCQENQ